MLVPVALTVVGLWEDIRLNYPNTRFTQGSACESRKFNLLAIS